MKISETEPDNPWKTRNSMIWTQTHTLGKGSWANDFVCPSRDHSSSAMCGAYGESSKTNASTTDFGCLSHWKYMPRKIDIIPSLCSSGWGNYCLLIRKVNKKQRGQSKRNPLTIKNKERKDSIFFSKNNTTHKRVSSLIIKHIYMQKHSYFFTLL